MNEQLPPDPKKLNGVLAGITFGKVKRPVYALLYGLDGVGKTYFASHAPNPVFIGIENGTFQRDVARFPKPETLNDVCAQLDGLATEQHPFKSAVVDTIDWLEPLIWRQICAEGNVNSVENYLGGFSKWHNREAEIWRSMILPRFETLAARMHVILIGHALVKTFNDPNQSSGYDRYLVKVQAVSAALIRESVDAVLFATYKTDLIRAKEAKGNRATSDGTRVMYTENRPAFDAKNRFNLPFEMPLEWPAFGQKVLAFYNSTPNGE